jgi:hypothetical protein
MTVVPPPIVNRTPYTERKLPRNTSGQTQKSRPRAGFFLFYGEPA